MGSQPLSPFLGDALPVSDGLQGDIHTQLYLGIGWGGGWELPLTLPVIIPGEACHTASTWLS
jgi:hypothetical protein